MKKGFIGGVHPPEEKQWTEAKPIEKVKAPPIVVIPLQQHTGAICESLVQVGNEVKVGQKIGEAKGFISAPIHSSISGKVIAIEPRAHPVGFTVPAIIIESDGKEIWDEQCGLKNINTLSQTQIRETIREAGIVGLGGAAFPTAVKLTPPEGKKIDTFILNGCECEPYLTADQRLMEEWTEQILVGMLIIMKVLQAEKGYIAIEHNKPRAIQKMIDVVKKATVVGKSRVPAGFSPRTVPEREDLPKFRINGIEITGSLEVVELKTKYPQGSEKHLIKAITGRVIPSGKLPLDVGVVVNNVGTALAVKEAVVDNKPLISRVITVTGNGIKEPKNLEVKIGTLIKDVIDHCGGFSDNGETDLIGKIILGGPMTGIAQYSLEIPIIKGTSGIVVFKKANIDLSETMDCIRCGKCISVCPMFLLPYMFVTYAERSLWDKAESEGITDCIECGCCSYVCPGRRSMVQAAKLVKAEILRRKKKAK